MPCWELERTRASWR